MTTTCSICNGPLDTELAALLSRMEDLGIAPVDAPLCAGCDTVLDLGDGLPVAVAEGTQ